MRRGGEKERRERIGTEGMISVVGEEMCFGV